MVNIIQFSLAMPILDTPIVYIDGTSTKDIKHKINAHAFVQTVEYTEIDEITQT